MSLENYYLHDHNGMQLVADSGETKALENVAIFYLSLFIKSLNGIWKNGIKRLFVLTQNVCNMLFMNVEDEIK